MTTDRIPFVHQIGAMSCGPTALTMVLRHLLDREIPVDEVTERLGKTVHGTNAAQLVAVAKSYGLKARGVAAGADAVSQLPMGSILHWAGQHYVVLIDANDEQVQVLDPACGHRELTPSVFREFYSGVALIISHPKFVDLDAR